MCAGRRCCASALGVVVGIVSLTALVTGFVSNVWLYTREPVALPNNQPPTTVTFKIGFWRVCPALNKTNYTVRLPSPSCSLIKYSSWDEVKHTDIGVFWSPLEFTPTLITKMRASMPFAAVAVLLLLFATLAALIGHCNNDHKTLIACALYTLAGLSLASGLVVFASVVSDVSLERPRGVAGGSSVTGKNSSGFQYRYGWSFFSAGAAFVLSEVAALLCITAYLRRFPTVEAMVRAVVPGAERKLLGRGSPPQPPPPVKAPPDLCTSEPQCQSCKKERERRMAGTTVPIAVHHRGSHTLRPQRTGPPPPPDYRRYATLGSHHVLHSGVLAVSEAASSWSSGSSSSVSSAPPRSHHHAKHSKANSLIPQQPVI